VRGSVCVALSMGERAVCCEVEWSVVSRERACVAGKPPPRVSWLRRWRVANLTSAGFVFAVCVCGLARCSPLPWSDSPLSCAAASDGVNGCAAAAAALRAHQCAKGHEANPRRPTTKPTQPRATRAAHKENAQHREKKAS
jgi:hypothetical protein